MKVWREVLTKNFILMIIAMIICGTAQMAVNTNSAAYAVGVLGLEQARFGTVVAIAGMVVVVFCWRPDLFYTCRVRDLHPLPSQDAFRCQDSDL